MNTSLTLSSSDFFFPCKVEVEVSALVSALHLVNDTSGRKGLEVLRRSKENPANVFSQLMKVFLVVELLPAACCEVRKTLNCLDAIVAS
jgi:hypothetical protein